jgi:hypothetical protein
LPEGLSVGGWLSLTNCTSLTSLPEDLSVGKNLVLDGCTSLLTPEAIPDSLMCIIRYHDKDYTVQEFKQFLRSQNAESYSNLERKILFDAYTGKLSNHEALKQWRDRLEKTPENLKVKLSSAKYASMNQYPARTNIPKLSNLPNIPYPKAKQEYRGKLVLGEKTTDLFPRMTTKEAHAYLDEGSTLDYMEWMIKKVDPEFSDLIPDYIEIIRWLVGNDVTNPRGGGVLRDPKRKEALYKERVIEEPANDENGNPIIENGRQVLRHVPDANGNFMYYKYVNKLDELRPEDLTHRWDKDDTGTWVKREYQKTSVVDVFKNAANRIEKELEEQGKNDNSVICEKPEWFVEQRGVYLLNTPTKLLTEGKEMAHCVGTYIEKVRAGQCVIVAFRFEKNGKYYRSTMELTPDGRGIRQHQAVHNQPVSKESEEFSLNWLRKCGVR